jgi:hypothetical protein
MSKNNKLLKNFLPFVILVGGSFFCLAQFRKLNYKYKRNDNLNVFQEQLIKSGGLAKEDYQARQTMSIKDEHDKLMKQIDINDWHNIRAPRPGQNSKQVQRDIRSKFEQEKKSTNKD